MAQAIRAILLARATAATFCVSALHRLARAMPGEDTFVIDLISALSTLYWRAEHIEKIAGRRGDPVICDVRDDAKQLTDADTMRALDCHKGINRPSCNPR